MSAKSSKTIWSTIKFPREFVADISAYSKENGWKSSCEFIMAAYAFIYKNELDLHGELPPESQTDIIYLTKAISAVANILQEFPDKADLIQQVNQLKVDLSSTQKDLDKALKANSSWKKAYDTLKEDNQKALADVKKQRQDALAVIEKQKQDALTEIDSQKQEVSRLTDMTNKQAEILQSITSKANETVQKIEDENSSWGRFGIDGKKLAVALETLRWIAEEVSQDP